MTTPKSPASESRVRHADRSQNAGVSAARHDILPDGKDVLGGENDGNVNVTKAKTSARARTSSRVPPPPKPAEQRRSQETRAAILDAAVSEFADRGFDGASIRDIAQRSSLQHQIITYHFRSKDILWRAAAEYTFKRIQEEWDTLAANPTDRTPSESLRLEYRTLFRYTVAFPEFHRFMRQAALTDNPRLGWVAQTVLKPLLARLLPKIQAAQDDGALPRIEPIVFHYMMVGLTAMLSEFGPQMKVASGVSSDDPEVVNAYWALVDDIVFAPGAQAVEAVKATQHKTARMRRAPQSNSSDDRKA